MSIQGHSDLECVVVYDPNLKGYHEILVSDYILQLQSLGFTDEEVNARLTALQTEKVNKLVEMGLDEETAQTQVEAKIPLLTINTQTNE